MHSNLKDSVFKESEFHKATASAIGNCVEVTSSPVGGLVGVRDSKNPQGLVLAFPCDVWSSFTEGLKKEGGLSH